MSGFAEGGFDGIAAGIRSYIEAILEIAVSADVVQISGASGSIFAGREGFIRIAPGIVVYIILVVDQYLQIDGVGVIDGNRYILAFFYGHFVGLHAAVSGGLAAVERQRHNGRSQLARNREAAGTAPGCALAHNLALVVAGRVGRPGERLCGGCFSNNNLAGERIGNGIHKVGFAGAAGGSYKIDLLADLEVFGIIISSLQTGRLGVGIVSKALPDAAYNAQFISKNGMAVQVLVAFAGQLGRPGEGGFSAGGGRDHIHVLADRIGIADNEFQALNVAFAAGASAEDDVFADVSNAFAHANGIQPKTVFYNKGSSATCAVTVGIRDCQRTVILAISIRGPSNGRNSFFGNKHIFVCFVAVNTPLNFGHGIRRDFTGVKQTGGESDGVVYADIGIGNDHLIQMDAIALSKADGYFCASGGRESQTHFGIVSVGAVVAVGFVR